VHGSNLGLRVGRRPDHRAVAGLGRGEEGGRDSGRGSDSVGVLCEPFLFRQNGGAHMDVDYQAAWVPFNDGDLDLSAALAVEWVERDCTEKNAVALPVTPKAATDGHVEGIRAFAAKHGHTTARGGRLVGVEVTARCSPTCPTLATSSSQPARPVCPVPRHAALPADRSPRKLDVALEHLAAERAKGTRRSRPLRDQR